MSIIISTAQSLSRQNWLMDLIEFNYFCFYKHYEGVFIILGGHSSEIIVYIYTLFVDFRYTYEQANKVVSWLPFSNLNVHGLITLTWVWLSFHVDLVNTDIRELICKNLRPFNYLFYQPFWPSVWCKGYSVAYLISFI